mmetsp:Transcript_23245/g.88056  ORF Transcript_23245/g.88056 Transcript_23245/m.88056 type:complete len:237 (-) Transcript_23245:638-1348(-)
MTERKRWKEASSGSVVVDMSSANRGIDGGGRGAADKAGGCWGAGGAACCCICCICCCCICCICCSCCACCSCCCCICCCRSCRKLSNEGRCPKPAATPRRWAKRISESPGTAGACRRLLWWWRRETWSAGGGRLSRPQATRRSPGPGTRSGRTRTAGTGACTAERVPDTLTRSWLPRLAACPALWPTLCLWEPAAWPWEALCLRPGRLASVCSKPKPSFERGLDDGWKGRTSLSVS